MTGTDDPTATLMAMFETIPAQLNPHADTAIRHLNQWVVEQGVVIAPAAKDRFEQANFGWFAAATYPTANETDLALIADWFVWLFLLDDQLDDGLLGENPERAGVLMTMIFDVLDGQVDRPGLGPGTPTIVTSLADLWQRTAASASSTWRRRFVDHVIAGGMAACWEADNRMRRVVPDEATYVQKRRHTGAIYVCMDLIEIVEHIDLPAEIYDREPFAGALRAACDVVGWTNDLYSLDKEVSMGEYHNLVAVIQHERALNRAEAIESVTHLIGERVQDFLREELAVHAVWPTHSTEVLGYLAGMRSWMRGNLDWSATTRRYRDTRRHRPDPTRYLEVGVVEQTERRDGPMSTSAIASRSTLVTYPEGQSARSLLLPVLQHWIGRLGGDLSRTCGYQLGLCKSDGTPTGEVGGKLLRPTFAFLCSAAAGGAPADVVPAATAIELLHNASLIHDDIMDGDRERRHRPTVWAEFSIPSAILAGDALIALAFEVLVGNKHQATSDAVADLAKTLRLMARGQNSDLRFESASRVGMDDCLAMMAGKTGGLLGWACRSGVAYARAPVTWLDRFEQFGTHLGVAFQLVDDVLGIWGDPRVTGKPVGSDLRGRKKSAPVVAALTAGTAASARLADLYSRARGFTDEEVTLLTELVTDAGGQTWALSEAERQLSAAWDLLDGLELEPSAHRSLTTLTSDLMNRDR